MNRRDISIRIAFSADDLGKAQKPINLHSCYVFLIFVVAHDSFLFLLVSILLLYALTAKKMTFKRRNAENPAEKVDGTSCVLY